MNREMIFRSFMDELAKIAKLKKEALAPLIAGGFRAAAQIAPFALGALGGANKTKPNPTVTV